MATLIYDAVCRVVQNLFYLVAFLLCAITKVQSDAKVADNLQSLVNLTNFEMILAEPTIEIAILEFQ